jgi:hypothetical protein
MTLNLTLKRIDQTDDGIFGQLTMPGLTAEVVTLENRALSIPAGQYGIAVYDSPHAGHLLPILLGVPGRDFVEIHSGNCPSDSKGCILLGLSRIGDTIGASRAAFDLVFPCIEASVDDKNPVTISIS